MDEEVEDNTKNYARGETHVPDLPASDVGLVQLHLDGGFSTSQMNKIMACVLCCIMLRCAAPTVALCDTDVAFQVPQRQGGRRMQQRFPAFVGKGCE